MLQKGVIVRSCDIWGYDRGIRVTVGTSEEVDLFLETLQDALREPGIKNQLSTGDDAHGSF
jgi:histidinol-phosphate aminotransferase